MAIRVDKNHWIGNYYSGGATKLGLCVHHYAGVVPDGQEGDCYDVWNRNGCSAHFSNANGFIIQYVALTDRAFHSGCALGNDYYIGIENANSAGEPDWKVGDKTYRGLVAFAVQLAQVMGWKQYQRSDKYAPGALFSHQELSGGTRCPGEYLQARMNWLLDDVNAKLKGASMAATGTLELWNFNGKVNQMYRFTPVGDYVMIETGIEGGVLDLKGNSIANGTAVIAYKATGKDNQLWAEVEEDVEGLISLHPKLDLSKALDITGASNNPGALAIIWAFKDTPNQKFQKKAVPGKPGWYFLQPQHSGNLWLDVTAGSLYQ
jgi:hypothetical protein